MSRRVIVPTEEPTEEAPASSRHRPIWMIAVVAVLAFAALDGGESPNRTQSPLIEEPVEPIGMAESSGPEWVQMAQLPRDSSLIHLDEDVQLVHQGDQVGARRGWFDEWRPAVRAADGRPLIGRFTLISTHSDLVGLLEDPDTNDLIVARSSDGFEWTLAETARPFGGMTHAATHEGATLIVLDGGDHWESVVVSAEGDITAVRHAGSALEAGWVDGLGLVVVTETDPVGLRRSVDMGATWEEVTLAFSGETEIFAGRLIVEQGPDWRFYDAEEDSLTRMRVPTGDSFGRISVGRTIAIRWLDGTAWLTEDLEAWVRVDRGIGELVTGHTGRMWLAGGSPHIEVYSPSQGLTIYRLDQTADPS